MILAALLAWQLAAVLISGMRAQEEVRAKALAADGRSGTVTVVTARAPVPAVLPGVDGLEMRARIGVRAP